MATTMPVMTNLCDCSVNGLKFWSPCTPQIGANCIQTFKCAIKGSYDPSDNVIGCTSFDSVAIERRIQNQSRMPASQFKDALEDVTVAQGRLSFKGSPEDFISMSSRVWGNPNYLRNQSDRSTPSRSGAWTGYGNRNHAFGMSVGGAKVNISGYVNVPTRGNSTRSTITGNRPGAMTPGGQGVDVKHGSYDRYLSKKKGAILSKPKQSVTQSQPLPLMWYRRGFYDTGNPQKVYDSAGVNNMSYKFTPVSLNQSCKGNSWCLYGSLGRRVSDGIPWNSTGQAHSIRIRAGTTLISNQTIFPPPNLNAFIFYLPDLTEINEIRSLKNTSNAIIVLFSDPKLGEPLDGWKFVILRPNSPNTLLNNNNNNGMWNYSETVPVAPPGPPGARITLFSQPPSTISNIGDIVTPINIVAKSSDDIVINEGVKLWIYEFNLQNY